MASAPRLLQAVDTLPRLSTKPHTVPPHGEHTMGTWEQVRRLTAAAFQRHPPPSPFEASRSPDRGSLAPRSLRGAQETSSAASPALVLGLAKRC